MKKFIMGIVLFLSGVIGFVGWSIACTNKVGRGASSTVMGCIYGIDRFIVITFVVIAIIGLIMSLRSMKKD